MLYATYVISFTVDSPPVAVMISRPDQRLGMVHFPKAAVPGLSGSIEAQIYLGIDKYGAFHGLRPYHCNSRRSHGSAPNTCMPSSLDQMARIAAFAYNGMTPLWSLMIITGTKAATKWHSEDGVPKAKESRELAVLGELTHASLYDHVDEAAGKKLVNCFEEYL